MAFATADRFRHSVEAIGVDFMPLLPGADFAASADEGVLSAPGYRARARALGSDMAAIDTRGEILGAFDRLASAGRRSS